MEPATAIDTRLYSQEERNWWYSNQKARDAFKLLIQGKALQEIKITLKMNDRGIHNLVRHPFFLKRLNDHLSNVFFNYQVMQILAMNEVFQYCLEVGLGKKETQGLTQRDALKYLISLVGLRGEKPTIINPKQYNFIMNILKADQTKIKSLAKEFGFEDLELDEGSKSHPQLDTGERDQDE